MYSAKTPPIMVPNTAPIAAPDENVAKAMDRDRDARGNACARIPSCESRQSRRVITVNSN